MKRFALSGIFSIIFLFSFSQTAFQKIYGGIHDDEESSSQQTSDGGYMITGSTSSYGAGYHDFYLVKTNSIGDTLWTRTYGTATEEMMGGAQQTADGGYVLGGTTYDVNANELVYVVKTNSSGTLSWSKSYFLMRHTQTTSIQQTSDGGFMVAGFCDSISGPTPYEYAFLLKLDPSGAIIWNTNYLINGFGNIRSRVKEISTGGYIMTGSCLNANSTTDVLVMKISALGNVLWAKAFDTGNYESGYDVVETVTGSFIVIAETESQATGIEMYILKISSAGVLNWSKKYNGTNYQTSPRAIIADTNGNFFIDGFNYSTSTGSGFLSKIDQGGQLLWTSIYGLNTYSGFYSIGFTNDGGIQMGGAISYQTIASDSGSLYLVKTDGNGNSGCGQSTFSFNTIIQPTTMSTAVVTSSNGFIPQNIATIVSSGCMVMDGCSVGMEEENNNSDVKVLPNPFSEKTTIKISENFSNEKKQFELFDVNGNVVREFYATGNTIELERENLSAGIYFYRIISENGILASGKIIAE